MAKTDADREAEFNRQADSRNRNDKPRDRSEEDRRFDAEAGAEGAPNGRDRERGWREGDPAADDLMPGREDGAGHQTDDGVEADANVAAP